MAYFQRLKARAKVDGWSAIFGEVTVYAAMGVLVLSCLRDAF